MPLDLHDIDWSPNLSVALTRKLRGNRNGMKRGAWLLAGSIVANVVLAAVLFETIGLSRSDRLPDRNDSALATNQIDSTPVVSPVLHPNTVNELRDDDLAIFAENLRAAGFEDRFVRAIINAEIDERFREREEALTPDHPKLPYWKFDDYEEPLETRLARLDLEREKARLRRETLGPDVTEDSDLPFAAEKWELAKMITEDYDLIIGELNQPHYRPVLPSEKAMMDRLEIEKRAELEALLTPEEITEFEFRTTVLAVSAGLEDFNATEKEIRLIYANQQRLREYFDGSDFDFVQRQGESSSDFIDRVNDQARKVQAEKDRMNNELREALGEERYADYRRERDYDYTGLKEMVERIGLPVDAAKQVYELRQRAANESERIGTDFSQSADARREAIASMAQSTTDQIQAILGNEGTQAYLNTPHSSWMRNLESGMIISFDGGGQSASGINEKPPPDHP